jgi:hypothetical protein
MGGGGEGGEVQLRKVNASSPITIRSEIEYCSTLLWLGTGDDRSKMKSKKKRADRQQLPCMRLVSKGSDQQPSELIIGVPIVIRSALRPPASDLVHSIFHVF